MPLPAHAILLLQGKNNAGMRFVLLHVARKESIEIPDVETVQPTTLRRGEVEVVLV